MDAYSAVHSKEAKEELNSQRDPISEMTTARLQDNDLRDLAEEILEEVFKTSTVKEAEDIIFNMIPESNIVGREEKLDRIYAAFGETFSKIRLKNKDQALEEFAKYRQSKRLEETWSARHNQDKRVARVHSTVVAEDKEVIKRGLLGLFEKKKGDPCWVGYKQVGMKKKGGKQVPNCVPANEAAQYDEMYKALPKEKMQRQTKKAYDKEQKAVAAGDEKEVNKQMQRRIAMTDPSGRKSALMKKEEFVAEKKGSKPDYLDFDGDGNKEEPMKKALKDKKHKKMKEELELSGKFSETEILKIIASL
tara:strand:+ start:291 stop:1205 length:915 start_codon:yes stop_codon:yes gene_type:complete